MPLSVLNLNCWLFPPPIATDCRKRLAAIIQLIRQHDADVVCLQEVWSNRYLRQITRVFPAYHAVSSGTPFLNRSGLLTLIKAKPTKVQVAHFPLSAQHNFTEKVFRKGFICVDATLQGQPFTVINTHLYAAVEASAKVITERQLTQIVAAAKARNILLCGDLNLPEQKVKHILGASFLRLCDSKPTWDVTNPYTSTNFNKFFGGLNPQSQKEDYLLYRGPLKVASRFQRLTKPLVSDHYGLFASLSFKGKS